MGDGDLIHVSLGTGESSLKLLTNSPAARVRVGEGQTLFKRGCWYSATRVRVGEPRQMPSKLR